MNDFWRMWMWMTDDNDDDEDDDENADDEWLTVRELLFDII